VLDVTVTLTVHVAPAARFPPVNATLFPPAVAEAVPLPHVVEAFGVPAIVTFAGSVSSRPGSSARRRGRRVGDRELEHRRAADENLRRRERLAQRDRGATFTVSVSVAGARWSHLDPTSRCSRGPY